MTRRLRARRPRRGAALLIAILVLLVMTIAGVALMFNSSTENALSGNETRMSKAFYAADSGIQYAAAKMATDINFFAGGVRTLPGGMSSNTPGSSTHDIDVSITPPLTLGYLKRPGDPIPSEGSKDPDIFEVIYRVESTASSREIQASKVITAQVSIYPQERSVK
jgi:hypothetical protein